MTQTESGGVIDSKPGSVSGALISATSPGRPAALTSFGARPKRAPPASCSASLVSFAAVLLGASSEAFKPSVIGHCATTARTPATPPRA